MKNILSVALGALLLASCADLDVENPNNADLDDVFSNYDEFNGVVNGQFNTAWWYDGAYYTHALSTMGDGTSMSWGNWGARELSSEPRVAINNTPTWSYAGDVLENPWNAYFSVIGSVNDILRIYAEDPEAKTYDAAGNDITAQVIAKAKFLQGHCYGNISKIYDQGKIVDETVGLGEVPELEYSDYKAMAAAAVQMLEDAITAANSTGEFTVGAWNGIEVSKADFIKICRSTQAKILLHNARTEAENAEIDWNAILTYTAGGVDFDFAPLGDGSVWWKPMIYYGNEEGWSRVDMRIISMLDPSMPSRFPTDGTTSIGPATSTDARLGDYMEYYESIPFRAERGYYHFSHYDFSRWDYHYPDATGAIPTIIESENDLIRAEALIRTNDKAGAATIINKTRQGNGGLSALTGAESDAAMLEALYRERWLELMGASAGTVFFDRRRLPEDGGSYGQFTGLQPCTARSFPIPAAELQLLGLELYTFGGCTE